MFRLLLAIPLAAGAAFFAAPAAEHPAVPVPHGVTIAGVPVGGLTAMPARTVLLHALQRPLRIEFHGKLWHVDATRFAAPGDVNEAVGTALHARPGSNVKLPISINRAAIRAYVKSVDRDFTRPGVDAALTGLDAQLRPVIRPDHNGRAVRRAALVDALASAARTGKRATITLPVRIRRPKVTAASFHSVIVIQRAANRLTLFDGRSIVRTFGVATGQAAYPTPSGTYEIVVMQRDPTWTPPDSPWAVGAKPIPPGPGNPLGTRWMGLSAPGVGIHGTPDDASIGYSQSHGCIRMHIPDAEWLFEHVTVGTPVVIV